MLSAPRPVWVSVWVRKKQHPKIATYEKQASDKAYQKQLTRQQKKQAQSAYDDHQKQLFEKKQALKKVTTWFFCNYEHQADFHERNAEQITPTIVK